MIDTHIGNNNKSKKIYLGTTEIKKMYYNSNVVYTGREQIIIVDGSFIDTTIFNTTNFGWYTAYGSSNVTSQLDNVNGTIYQRTQLQNNGWRNMNWSGTKIGTTYNYNWLPAGTYDIIYDIDVTDFSQPGGTCNVLISATTTQVYGGVVITGTGHYSGVFQSVPKGVNFNLVDQGGGITGRVEVGYKINKLIFEKI